MEQSSSNETTWGTKIGKYLGTLLGIVIITFLGSVYAGILTGIAVFGFRVGSLLIGKITS